MIEGVLRLGCIPPPKTPGLAEIGSAKSLDDDAASVTLLEVYRDRHLEIPAVPTSLEVERI